MPRVARDSAIPDPYAPPAPLRSTMATALAALDPPAPALLGPVAPGTITLVRGQRGVGKSWLVLAMAQAIAGGSALLGWPARQAPVLHIDAAMSRAQLGDRLRRLGAAPDLQIACDLRLDLTGEQDQASVIDSLPEGGILVLDGLALLTRPGREAWECFLAWLRDLRRSGHAVVLVEPAARPVLAALADTVVTLKPGADRDLSFAVEIASRQPMTAADRAFAVRVDFGDGTATWSRSTQVPPELAAVVDAARGGGTVRDIAGRLGLATATAWRRLEKAKALGLIPRETDGTDPEGERPYAVPETGGTGQRDLTGVSTAVLKRTLARRAEMPMQDGRRAGPAILSGYDDAALVAECARRLKPPQAARLMARFAPAMAAE